MKKRFVLSTSVFLFIALTGVANAFTVDTTGSWSTVTGGNSSAISGLGTNALTWGTTNISSLEFVGNGYMTFDLGDTFSLGTFTHSNANNARGTSPDSADLILTITNGIIIGRCG